MFTFRFFRWYMPENAPTNAEMDDSDSIPVYEIDQDTKEEIQVGQCSFANMQPDIAVEHFARLACSDTLHCYPIIWDDCEKNWVVF